MRDRKADNLGRKQLRLEQCVWTNRQELTPSEARLWPALEARQLGVQFRREVRSRGATSWIFAPLRCASWLRSMVAVTSRGRGRMRGGMRSFAGLGTACCALRPRSSCAICRPWLRLFARRSCRERAANIGLYRPV